MKAEVSEKYHVLLTGGAGFIGSHIADALVNHSKIGKIRILDNLSTGSLGNISHLLDHPDVTFIEGDIRDIETCISVAEGVTHICHQAALGSVPRSVNDPVTTNAVNISGTLNMLEAARRTNVSRFVYAASSSTYGDHQGLPKVEDNIGKPLSPYAVTKLVNELYADVYSRLYDMEVIGLRYFNIFGPRQSPDGPYAAVIPLFIQAFRENRSPVINGDGSYSRDFTYIENAVQANLKALFTDNSLALNNIYNIACGYATTLTEIVENLQEISGKQIAAFHGPGRTGDIPHSLADITKAEKLLGYQPTILLKEGLENTWFFFQSNK